MKFLFKVYRSLFKGALLKGRVVRIVVLAVALNLVFAASFYLSERRVQPELTPLDAFWWAMVTMTTVGYGEQLITNAVGSQLYIFDTRLQGRKISEVQIAVVEHPQNLQVIGIARDGQICLNPSKTEVIREGDRLIMLANEYGDFTALEDEILQVSR